MSGKVNELAALVCVDDFEREALKKLPAPASGYYSSGADREQALRRNREAYSELILRPLRLHDVSRIELRCDFLGAMAASPIAVAATAFHKMATPDGEKATRLAASRTGSLMMLSSLSNTTLEDVAASISSTAPLWYQLYIFRDRSTTTRLLTRAAAAGYKAIVVTIDTPVLGRRLADERLGFQLPDHLSIANLLEETHVESRVEDGQRGQSALSRFAKDNIVPTLSWLDLEWIVKETTLPVIVKGVVREDDAERAIDCGVRGIIVSNHGGRQLDSAPATIWALPEVVRAAKSRVPVWVDGGIRSGEDVFKALALGASGVFVGRPILWGLTCGVISFLLNYVRTHSANNQGAEGAERVLRVLNSELTRTMQLMGCRSLREIHTNNKNRDLVVHVSHYHKL